MALYFITGNKNKFAEVSAILPSVEQIDIDLPEVQDIDAKEIIKAKLLEALNHKQAKFIVEDTSLYFNCLNGLPGPLIKWFMKTVGNEGLFNMVKNWVITKQRPKPLLDMPRILMKFIILKALLRVVLFRRLESLVLAGIEFFNPKVFPKVLPN